MPKPWQNTKGGSTATVAEADGKAEVDNFGDSGEVKSVGTASSGRYDGGARYLN